MATSDDDRRRRKKKSHKHDDDSRKYKSSRRSSRDDDRHSRHKDNDRHKHKSSSSKRADTDDKNKHNKLTEEEERLYAKAQQYVESQKKDKDRSKHSKSSSSKRRRRSRSESSESISDEKHSSRRKEHKHSKKRSKHSHRDRDDKDKKHKKKHTESSKSSSKKAKHTSFKDKATKIDTSKLVSLGDITHEFPPKLDAETGYFSHNSHLRLYLYRKYGIYFEDLDSSESHEAFKEFTTLYNTGKLEKAYYNELLPQDAIDQCSRTKHKWAFKTNRTEKQSLSMVKAGVKKQTEYSSDKKQPPMAANMATASVAKGRAVSIGPARPNQDDQQQQAAAQRAAQRQSDIQHRNRIKLANEDMYGKSDPGSRDRQMEKKREMSAKLHGASRDKDSEVFGELDDDAIYGGGGISGGRGRGRKGEATYEDALAREKTYKERKESEKAARHSELLQKEELKQKQMMEMLGLGNLVKSGKKITIAPRAPE